MTSYLLAGPALEPLTLAEAKTYCRVDDSAEDGLLATLITAARLHIEGITGRALIAQTWRLVMDCWPAERAVQLPVSPLASLSAVTAFDEAGDPHELDLDQFQTEASPARLLLPDEIEGLPTLRERQGIEIDYVAGFGAAADEVPADLRQALRTLVAYWFENRDAVIVAGSGAVVPPGFDRLLAPYRRVRL